MSRAKRWIRSGVFVAWAASMALLWRDLHPAIALSRPRAPVSAAAVERWQGIYGPAGKIGWARRSRSPTVDGFRIETEAHMQLAMMGMPRLVETTVVAETDPRLELRYFDFRLRSGTVDFALTGEATPRGLNLSSAALGSRTVELPLSTPVVLAETLQEFLGQEKLEDGAVFHYALFDPMSGAPATVTLRVGPEETLDLPDGPRTAFRVDQEWQSSRFRLWVEPGGEVVKEEGPLGMTLVAESADRARRGIAGGGGLDLTEAASIPVARPIAEPRSAARLRLRFEGVPDAAKLSDPPRQSLELTGQGAAHLTVVRIDPPGTFALPAAAERFRDDLAATPFLQSDHALVRGEARKIVGDETDARRAAGLLLDWVYRTLAKVPTVSVPNALEVLQTRQGDCNEHAVLFAALARAAGLPARVVAGIVYMPGEGDRPGAFYYHAWDEVWLGGWTAVDPTFGQLPADATHVKLVEGGPEAHMALVGVLGKLKLEVEDGA